MKVLPYITAIILLMLSYNCEYSCGQWAQTFGWGGAGNGKRSSVNEANTCNIDLQLVKLIATLIQHELKRLKACHDEKVPQDLLEI